MRSVSDDLRDTTGRVLEVGDVVQADDGKIWLCRPSDKKRRRPVPLRYIGHIDISEEYKMDDWVYRNADYAGTDGRTERVHVSVFIPRSSRLHTGERLDELDALISGFRCMGARGVWTEQPA